ncbi:MULTISPECIES: type I polyketide synthase [unclassified Streptomyces]|uniref:type I polyketide synthase n=1 Tax=unclassified Streptomyces TaxID=2593676 RepID=UPI000379697B|nr:MULTISPECIES: type I polyketide synthase [unclassified Streptomyces]MYT33825.1 type I polyketide synthase [Streptomyces sp. SID8354]
MTGEPIAIVGIAGRFAGADGVDALWRLLRAGRSAVAEIPPNRFDTTEIYAPEPRSAGKTVSRWGGLIDRVDEFDAEFFGISPREAAQMDPQQRLLLEVSHEALEDAGLTFGDLAGSSAGTFIGEHNGDYWSLQNSARDELNLYSLTGAAARAVMSGRISYTYDLRGPSMSLDTACSSSLVAVHVACQSLRSGESSLALAGGTNLVLLPEESIGYSSAGMLSAEGQCKFGDAGADGFVRSDGVGILVLKPLSRALADRDRVRAVILGSAVNNDGRSSGFMVTPGVEGQRRVLERAYQDAGVDPATVDYVEAHGTGTAVGDPVELEALATVLGAGRPADHPLLLGSVKTNLGHTEAAAGVAGLLKTVLCLEHREIPPSLHFHTPNPAIPWGTWPVRIADRRTELPAGDRPHIAGVSSFGFSGTNAHIVLRAATAEEADPTTRSAVDDPAEATGAGLLTLSAVTPAALDALAGSYRSFLADANTGAGQAFRDICFSSSVRRSHHDHRLAIAAASHAQALEALRAYADRDPAPGLSAGEVPGTQRPRIAFVFPGQGSQWLGMGRELLTASQAFRTAMQACDKAVQAEAGWSVLDLLRDGTEERLGQLDIVQPALWAMEVALAATWRSWGVEPDVVIGHSMGEAAAVAVSGALSLEDAAAVICRRSALAKRRSGRGAMAWVELSAEHAQEALAGYEHAVSVAASNSPRATLLSGEPQALDAILASLDRRDVFTRLVKVDFASHSPQMDELRDDLVESLRGLRPKAGTTPLRSTVDNRLIDGSDCDADYWARNLRQPVRFSEAVAAELDTGQRTVFIEMSPHALLLNSISETAEDRGKATLAVGSLRRDHPELPTLLGALGNLYAAGVDIDFGAVNAGGSFVRVPAYPWQRDSHWLPARASDRPHEPAATPAPASAAHPLLPARTGDGVWEGKLDRAANRYLEDHRVQHTPILPGTAYVELLLAAGSELYGEVPLAVADVTYHTPLFLTDGWERTLRITVDDDGSEHARCRIETRPSADDAWTAHVTAGLKRISRPVPAGDPAVPKHRPDSVYMSGSEFYAHHAQRGNQWEGSFQGITELRRTDGEVWAELQSPTAIRPTIGSHRFHPALLDACAHTLAAAPPASHEPSPDDVFVLGGIDEVRLYRPVTADLRTHARLLPQAPQGSFCGDIRILDPDGEPIAEIIGIRLQYLIGNGTAAAQAAAFTPTPARTPAPRPAAPNDPPQRNPVPQETLPNEGTAPVTPPALPDDVHDMLYELRWQASAPPARRAHDDGDRTPGTWLVLADSDKAGRIVAAGLRDAGTTVCIATPAAAFERLTTDRFRVAPGSADDLAALVREVSALGPIRGIVHLWALAAVDVETPTRTQLRRYEQLAGSSVLHLLKAVQAAELSDAPRVWLVSRHAQSAGAADPVTAPFQAPLWGLGRAAAVEHPELRLSCADIGRDDSSAESLAAELLADDVESEILLRGDNRYVARLTRRSTTHDAAARSTGAVARRPEPATDEILIRVSHAGAEPVSGAPERSGRRPVTVWECSGTVEAVGSGVSDLTEGDEVIALVATRPAQYTCAKRVLTAAKPQRLSHAEAATLPLAFAAAYHALEERTRLLGQERVLINDAASGPGMAATQLARLKGARIHGTADGEHQRTALDLYGVHRPEEDTSYDVVLSTVARKEGPAGLSQAGPYGRYVDLTGGRGTSRPELPLPGQMYCPVDVAYLVAHEPDRAGTIVRTVAAMAEKGVLQALPYEEIPHDGTPLQESPADGTYPAGGAEDHGDRVGRLLVRFGDTSTPVAEDAAPSGISTFPREQQPLVIRDNATYLITGGLGGIGLRLAERLTARGAQHLLLIGRRSTPDQEQEVGLKQLRASGADVAYAAVDVADETALRTLLAERAAEGRPPVAGVAHAAGVIEYQALNDTDTARLASLLQPKVLGGWALHRVFADQPLDFFLLFSSASALLGSPLLGGYAAGNAFLDALTSFRRGRGATATAVNWGFWNTVGMIADAESVQGRSLRPRGSYGMEPDEALAVLEHLLAEDARQTVVMRTDWTEWQAAYPQAGTSPQLREVLRTVPDAPRTRLSDLPVPKPDGSRTDESRADAPKPTPSAPDLRSTAPVRQAPPTPSVPETPAVPAPRTSTAERSQAPGQATPDDLTDALAGQVASVLGMGVERVNRHRPLTKLGIDSLMMVEFRNRVSRELGVQIPIVKILSGDSLESLADWVRDELAAGKK